MVFSYILQKIYAEAVNNTSEITYNEADMKEFISFPVEMVWDYDSNRKHCGGVWGAGTMRFLSATIIADLLVRPNTKETYENDENGLNLLCTWCHNSWGYLSDETYRTVKQFKERFGDMALHYMDNNTCSFYVKNLKFEVPNKRIIMMNYDEPPEKLDITDVTFPMMNMLGFFFKDEFRHVPTRIMIENYKGPVNISYQLFLPMRDLYDWWVGSGRRLQYVSAVLPEVVPFCLSAALDYKYVRFGLEGLFSFFPDLIYYAKRGDVATLRRVVVDFPNYAISPQGGRLILSFWHAALSAAIFADQMDVVRYLMEYQMKWSWKEFSRYCTQKPPEISADMREYLKEKHAIDLPDEIPHCHLPQLDFSHIK